MIFNAYPADIDTRVGAGNWKDIRGIELLLQCAVEDQQSVVNLPFDVNQPTSLLEKINEKMAMQSDNQLTTTVEQKTSPHHLVLHYSWWPQLLLQVKQQYPSLNIIVRLHNAEAWHHWARYRPSTSWQGLPKLIYGCLRLAYRDWQTCRAADYLLGISAWDNQHYWRRLNRWGRLKHQTRLLSTPYFCPWPKLPTESLTVAAPPAWSARSAQIVSMPGGGDAISQDQRNRFAKLAEALIKHNDTAENHIRCVATGGIIDPATRASSTTPNTTKPSPVVTLGAIKSPFELLQNSKAVAILSPRGYGFKTTILDAITAGCHVLLHPVLMDRIPQEIAKHCIALDTQQPISSQSIHQLITRLLSEPTHSGLTTNDAMYEQASKTVKLGIQNAIN